MEYLKKSHAGVRNTIRKVAAYLKWLYSQKPVISSMLSIHYKIQILVLFIKVNYSYVMTTLEIVLNCRKYVREKLVIFFVFDTVLKTSSNKS